MRHSLRIIPLLRSGCFAVPLLILALWLTGCDALCTTQDVSYEACIQPTLHANCIGDGCHGGDTPAAGLSLDGNAYENTVDRPSNTKPGTVLIKPGAPDQSYLFQKLLSNAAISGQIMPLQRPALTPQQIDVIRAWIQAGAKK